jgi:hypothetical protein
LDDSNVFDRENEQAEVTKLARRLKLWASRLKQMNMRILIEYLAMKRNAHAKTTESQFKKASTTLPSLAISSE